MPAPYNLDGQVAVVTGSTSGIGQALAEALARQGVSLVLTYRGEFENVTRASGVDGLIKRLQQKNA